MERPNDKYSTQRSQSTFQPQNYRQSGLEQVNQGRAEMHSSSGSNSLEAQQPLVGIIDQGFGVGEHGAEVVKTIAESNPQSPAWLGGGVGNGNWANSLTKFVDAAKTLGKQAVANLSFDLTEKHLDGSVTTRSQLTTAEQQALSYAQENGVLIVASSGNQGGAMSALGQASQQFDNIIAVGAADGNHRASYSSFGTGLDLVAPGRETGDSFTGTSRSAAEVTGTISQMWAANPTLDYRQVSRVLEATATDLQAHGKDAETGAGLLNSRAAVNLAAAVTPETQLFSGAQLMQQVHGSFNNSPWVSKDGAVASERPNRELIGESIQEDRQIRAAYRAQTQVKQKPLVQTSAPKSPVRQEKPLNRFEHAEAANIRREERVATERQRLAREKAALTKIARNPGVSLADRTEARSILQKQKVTTQPPIPPKPPVSRDKPNVIISPRKTGNNQREQPAAEKIQWHVKETLVPKPRLEVSVGKEKPLNSYERKEAASIHRESLAREQAALTQIARDPHASTADRNEAHSILQKAQLTQKTALTVQPRETLWSIAENKLGDRNWWTKLLSEGKPEATLGKPKPPRPPGPHNEGNNHPNNPESNDQKRSGGGLDRKGPNYKVDENSDDQQDSIKIDGYADADANAGVKDDKAFAEASAKAGLETDIFLPWKVEASATGRAAIGTSETGAHGEVKVEAGNNVFGYSVSASAGAGGDHGEGEYGGGGSFGADLGVRWGNAQENGNELGATVGVGDGANGALIWGADIDDDGQKEYGAEFGLRGGPGAGINIRFEPNAVKTRAVEFGEAVRGRTIQGTPLEKGTPLDRLAVSIGNKAVEKAKSVGNKAVGEARSIGNKAIEKAKGTGNKVGHTARDIGHKIIDNFPIL